MKKSFVIFLGAFFVSMAAMADWSAPVQVSVDPVTQGFVRQLDVDGSGNALLVWTEGMKEIVGSEFDGQDWSEPQTLFVDEDDILKVSIAKSLINDRAVLSYLTAERGISNVKASIFDGTSWSAIERLIENNAVPVNIGLDMNVKGDALDIGVKRRWPDINTVDVQSFFAQESSFVGPIGADTFTDDAIPPYPYLSDYSVSTGDYPLREKKTYAVWFNNDLVILKSFDEATKTWSFVRQWDPTDTETFAYVAANGLGQIFVAWLDSSQEKIFGDYFDGTVWDGAAELAYPNEDIEDVTVGIDENGVPHFVLSTEYDDSTGSVVAGFRNPATSSWVITTLDQASSTRRLGGSTLAVHADGAALAVWAVKPSSSTEDYQLVYKRYLPGFGWSSWIQELVDLDESIFDVNAPRAAISRDGTAIVAWHDLVEEGKKQVFSLSDPMFTNPAVPVPPQNLIGCKKKNSFLTEAEYFNVLSWDETCDPVVVSYRLYRNGEKIADIPLSGKPCFVDHNRCKKGEDLYELTAVNELGEESEPVSISL